MGHRIELLPPCLTNRRGVWSCPNDGRPARALQSENAKSAAPLALRRSAEAFRRSRWETVARGHEVSARAQLLEFRIADDGESRAHSQRISAEGESFVVRSWKDRADIDSDPPDRVLPRRRRQGRTAYRGRPSSFGRRCAVCCDAPNSLVADSCARERARRSRCRGFRRQRKREPFGRPVILKIFRTRSGAWGVG